jgi:threonine synthase
MDYVSTRGGAPALDFRGVTMAGLASDGGLYLPQRWPQLSPADFSALKDRSYAETATQVMLPFVGDSIAPDLFAAMVEACYSEFGHPAVAPLVQLDHRHWLLELHHGPTLAFKDIALQLLGRLFEHFLGPTGGEMTILGATSGDTGSAAIHAVAGRPGMRIVMLHPAGRVSEVQRRQMTTVMAANVHNIAIDGSFDDAQALVKALFNDREFRAEMALSAVNSINWARLMAQIVYYVFAAVRLGALDRPVSFSVPTGNFGDVFAGHAAARMGLPVGQLIVATNENDIVARAIGRGDYSRGAVTSTATPSMDIQVSSNFERLLHDAGNGDGARTAAFMQTFEESGRLALPEPLREAIGARFRGHRVDGAAMQRTLGETHESCGMLIDPHTAIGLAAARALGAEVDGPIVTLATAHPAKFPEAVERATGIRPPLPRRIAHLMDRAERYERLPADAGMLKEHIRALSSRAEAA